MIYDWHALEPAQVAGRFGVEPARGLDEAEAASRLAAYGPNKPTVRPGRSAIGRFAAQMGQPLVIVLILAGCVTMLLGEWVDTGVIFGVVLINALVGFIQEGKAESALAALAQSIATAATVLRAGSRRQLDAVELVPGDVVVLSAGDRVPADIRLFSAKELRLAESALTGESVPVGKSADTLPEDTPLAERANMVYAGTQVVGGQGGGVVVATGDATETGHISDMLAQAGELGTPLTRKMAEFARRLLVAILVLAAVTFAVGVWRGEPAAEMFMAAVALAVGAIPEGLPAAMTITLAIGVSRMARRRAIIRRLPAVETLGSTTVICSDKTGTLTENAMTVREIRAGGLVFAVGGHGYGGAGRIECDGRPATATGALRETLVAGVLCNDARLVGDDRHPTVVGDPTEAALLVAARKAGFDERTLVSVFPRLDELPFDSARLTMATLHEIEGARVVYVKGAVEALLPACATMLDTEGAEQPVNPPEILEAAAQMARGGLRVLALARSGLEAGAILDHSRLGRRMVLLGLVGMIDPPRQRAHAAVRTCHAAGIRVKMITGDHPGTALAIARQLGIAGESAGAVTGRELAGLDDRALCRTVADVDVFARIEPEQKLRLVRALQAGGEVVAMTGDGVNDAPAVKQADIGIAMGRGGTEVAKEAAAMVLTDDNFATIEAAVEEGRGIYDNLVKFITWTIPTNAGEGLVILAAVFAGTALPITPLQILWINMTTAILLGLTLAFEPVERGIMLRRPRPPAAPVLDGVLVRRIVLVGLLMLAGAFGLFELALRQGSSLAEARTVAANVFVMVEIFYLFSCRSLAAPFWTVGPLANPWIWAGVGTMIVLQSIFTYVPVFNGVFGTAPIGLGEWGLILGFSALSMAVVELDKRIGATGRHAAAQAQ